MPPSEIASHASMSLVTETAVRHVVAPLHERITALLIDVFIGLAILVTMIVVAVGFLLLRTDGGSRDVASTDATLALALMLASVPGWLVWLGVSLVLGRATPGQAWRGIEVRGGRTARLLRLAVHPLSAPGWFWLAVVSTIALLPLLPILLAATGALTLLMGLLSGLMLAVRPHTLALHDRFAGTRVYLR